MTTLELTPTPIPSKQTTFDELGLSPELLAACTSLGWHCPTDIQREAIPHALKGRDIIGLAETGSGKTAAFALPIVHTLLETVHSTTHTHACRLYGVVLAPTRELCVQISNQFIAIGSTLSLQVATIVGGLPMTTQAIALAKKPHIIVASPGRLVDHLENTKGFSLNTIKFLVMDEADKLLTLDFEEALDKILNSIPKTRQTFLFSATMTSKVSKLQKASLKNPIKIEVNLKYNTVKELVQNYILVPFKFKWTYISAILQNYQNYFSIVFCNTCLTAMKLAIFLRYLGFSSTCLHGKLSQVQRMGALNSFVAGNKKILVATEVGSRGLDIPAVDIVINFDVPTSSKDYIHRVGRTARAGRSGRAITIVTQYDIECYQRVEVAINKKLDEFKEVEESTAMSLHENVLEALRVSDLEIRELDQNKLFPKKNKYKQTSSKSINKKKKF